MCLVELADSRAPHPAATIELVQEHQVVVVFRLLNPRPRLRAERPGAQGLGVHVVRDQPPRALGDRPFQGLQGGLDVIRRVDRLADVVQERRQQKFLVVRTLSRASSKTCRLW